MAESDDDTDDRQLVNGVSQDPLASPLVGVDAADAADAPDSGRPSLSGVCVCAGREHARAAPSLVILSATQQRAVHGACSRVRRARRANSARAGTHLGFARPGAVAAPGRAAQARAACQRRAQARGARRRIRCVLPCRWRRRGHHGRPRFPEYEARVTHEPTTAMLKAATALAVLGGAAVCGAFQMPTGAHTWRHRAARPAPLPLRPQRRAGPVCSAAGEGSTTSARSTAQRLCRTPSARRAADARAAVAGEGLLARRALLFAAVLTSTGGAAKCMYAFLGTFSLLARTCRPTHVSVRDACMRRDARIPCVCMRVYACMHVRMCACLMVSMHACMHAC